HLVTYRPGHGLLQILTHEIEGFLDLGQAVGPHVGLLTTIDAGLKSREGNDGNQCENRQSDQQLDQRESATALLSSLHCRISANEACSRQSQHTRLPLVPIAAHSTTPPSSPSSGTVPPDTLRTSGSS